jgi:colicin import membrane protein
MPPSDRVRARGTRGKWLAALLAVFVNLLFVGVLVFSVSWQNRAPEVVSAELYAPPSKTPAPTPPAPEPPKPPPPEPPKPPPPEPPKPQKVEPPPAPKAPDIALKAKQEAERIKREREEEQQRRESEAKAKAEEKRLAELKDRQKREIDSMRAQAERESQLRAQAEQESQIRAQQTAAANANRSKAQADWIERIRAKIRGNVNTPDNLTGNPEAIFEVAQLPTGEIIDARLRKSSGVRAYDEAVERAILKSSPLPRPDRPEIFERTLILKFRPLD